MKAILYFVAGLVLANIIAATFIWPPRKEAPPAPVANAATRQGLDPWMVNEKDNAESRDRTRKGVLKALDQPWSTWCSPEGHERLVRSIDSYFYRREAEAWSKGNTYGEGGRRFAIKAWTTTDDTHIERLVGEAVERGYLSLDEFKSYARKPMNAFVKDATGPKPCAN